MMFGRKSSVTTFDPRSRRVWGSLGAVEQFVVGNPTIKGILTDLVVKALSWTDTEASNHNDAVDYGSERFSLDSGLIDEFPSLHSDRR